MLTFATASKWAWPKGHATLQARHPIHWPSSMITRCVSMSRRHALVGQARAQDGVSQWWHVSGAGKPSATDQTLMCDRWGADSSAPPQPSGYVASGHVQLCE